MTARATHCTKCGRKLKAECPRQKYRPCLECEDGCVRADDDHGHCRRCKYAQDAIYRERARSRTLDHHQEIERQTRQRLSNHRPWHSGPFTFTNLGTDGVRLACGDDDESEAVLLDTEQVRELKAWLEAR